MSRVGNGLGALFAALLWSSCVDVHTSPGGSSSSGSNWLRCHELADCSEAPAAVACGQDGFCTDARGEHIALRATAENGGDEPISMSSSEKDAGAATQCAWGVDDLLAEAHATAPNRRNCGWYWSTNSAASLQGAMACFDQALADHAAVQISFNFCADCWLRTTYVVTESGEHFEIVMDDDSFGGDGLRDATVHSCESLVADPRLTLTCSGATTLYECSEPRAGPRPLPADPVVEPFKLMDLANASTVLHVYVSNQSLAEPLADIAVTIDNDQVIAGDFAVEDQHNFYTFDVGVPTGTLRLSALSFGEDEAISLGPQDIAVPNERWAVLSYWYDPGSLDGRHFTLNVSDVPVSFE
jgi:hypothetical protein